ncbi:MAG TPA: hypothetical protein VIV58_09380 [Kofleriaceae bacterium]
MSTFTSSLAAIMMCVVGCSSKSEPPPPAKAPPVTSALDGKRAHGMLNCPSGVEGSATKMKMTAADVVLTITAPEVNAQHKIVTLAHAQERAGNPHGGLINNGEHGGPGSSGFCPIIHADTVISVEEISGGVIVHVRPSDPAQLQALGTAIAARVDAIGGTRS